VTLGNLFVQFARLMLSLTILSIAGGALSAQGLPFSAVGSPSPFQPQPGARPVGFLEKDLLSYVSLIPPYPVLQSLEDEADVAGVRQWRQSGNSPRWQLAKADAEVSYRRFAEAFGSAIDRAAAPLLVHLLDRVETDLSGVLGTAKMNYNRPRPYQRFQMDQVCGFSSAPSAEASPKGGDSYPSGHATFGWSVALVLAAVAPDRAPIILARGREYGESRIVCGVHYPSDVHAGELLVSSMVGRLYLVPEFRRELSCARQEHEAATKVLGQLTPECAALKDELEPKLPSNKAP